MENLFLTLLTPLLSPPDEAFGVGREKYPSAAKGTRGARVIHVWKIILPSPSERGWGEVSSKVQELIFYNKPLLVFTILLLLIGCRQPLALKPGDCVEMSLVERDKMESEQGYEAIATRTAVHDTTAPDLRIAFVDQDAGPVRDATIQINQQIAKTDSSGRAYVYAFAPNEGIFDIQVTALNKPCIYLRAVHFGSGDILSIHLESP